MELALFVYIAGVIGQIVALIGNIAAFATAFGVIILTLTGAAIPFLYDTDMCKEGTRAKVLVWAKRALLFVCLPVALLTSCTKAILPSEKTLYLMGGAYATQAVVQSETADKVLKIVNSKLDEYLEEVEKSVKEEVKK